MRTFSSIAVFSLVSVVPALAQSTLRVSVSTGGMQASDFCGGAHVSDDGRRVAFFSRARSLLPAGDLGGPSNVFVHDRVNGTTTLVSATAAGTSGNSDSYLWANSRVFSGHARKVTFWSLASNLVAGDVPATIDVFVRDLGAGTTVRASTDALGQGGNGHSQLGSISADGRWVVFETFATNLFLADADTNPDVVVKDLATGAVELVNVAFTGSQAVGKNKEAVISPDARWVAFVSDSNFVVAGDSNGVSDIFVRDRTNGTTQRVSVSLSGIQANDESDLPSISDDGSRVLFRSLATNLVPNDSNGVYDVFVRDRSVQTTIRVSISTNGVEGNALSGAGQLSADGRYAAFWSVASTLVAGDTNLSSDVFRYDVNTGVQELVSQSSTGAVGYDNSFDPQLSADGSVVAFDSMVFSLIAGDANNAKDIFVRDFPSTATPIVGYCTAKPSSNGCMPMLATSGVASASTTDAFRLCAGNLPISKNGLLFWGLAPSATPFLGGTLCVAPPTVRTPVVNSSFNLSISTQCQGAAAFVMSQSYLASHGLVPGVDAYAQFWLRDNGYAPPNNVALSDAVTFHIEP